MRGQGYLHGTHTRLLPSTAAAAHTVRCTLLNRKPRAFIAWLCKAGQLFSLQAMQWLL